VTLLNPPGVFQVNFAAIRQGEVEGVFPIVLVNLSGGAVAAFG
jgi:hypothetical protein